MGEGHGVTSCRLAPTLPEGRGKQEKLSCKGFQLRFSTLRGSSSVHTGLVFVKHPAPAAQPRSTLFLPSF